MNTPLLVSPSKPSNWWMLVSLTYTRHKINQSPASNAKTYLLNLLLQDSLDSLSCLGQARVLLVAKHNHWGTRKLLHLEYTYRRKNNIYLFLFSLVREDVMEELGHVLDLLGHRVAVHYVQDSPGRAGKLIHNAASNSFMTRNIH